ncbi:MAG: site-specific integrase [Flavobacteriales bacterium]|jgi:site-specific recombinase XerD|uniref:tyrosine-type recombinase/integrase n=1 Tax=Candidatus Ulvibacter alkanivorans TaxID=2267620 RepID=UPI000DF32629|nr:tyrosine-type recombinase/integrase [Candidatus Ulvibacter alkanivorans]MCH2489279.1 site-specific integrase [Flavobacteriales bacterium]
MGKLIERAKGTTRFAFKESLKKLQQSPNDESLIMLHYSYGKLRFKYSTSYYASLNDWDYKKQRVRNKTHILNRNEINDYLDDVETAIKRQVSYLDANQIPITKEALKSSLDEYSNKNISLEKKEKVNFHSYCEMFFERKQGSIKDVTLRSYRQTKKLIERYDNQLSTKTDFNTIDLSFYYDFVGFLEEDDKSLNTIGKHIKNLKTILNSATDDGYNTNKAYKSTQFKAKTEQTTAIYLTDEELEKIHDLDLSKYKELERARDIFLIGCYTGQRISDYNGLDHNDIFTKDGVRFVKIKQRKVKNVEVDAPITVKMWEIMQTRYNGKFPNRMTEQYINDYIKQVAQMAGIDEKIKCTRTKGGKEIVKWLPKHNMVGTHTARRSFCTNLFKKGVGPDYIMHFSGHKGVKEFYKYIRIKNEEKSLHIAKSGIFNLA